MTDEQKVITLPPEFLPKLEKKRNWFWAIIIGVVVLVALGGVGAYFYLVKKNIPPPVVVAPEPIPEPPPAPIIPEPIPEPPPPVVETPPTPQILQAAPDTDGDGLTDEEELLYKTNPQNPDTDADNFIDGNEVFKLYSPIAGGVAQIADSGLVKFFTNDKQNYSVLYPVVFGLDIIEATSTAKIAFTVPTGERFVITILENDGRLSPLNYYLNAHPDVPITEISAASSRGGFSGVTSPDGLETILNVDGKLLSVTYDVGGNITKRFANTYHMIINSIRLIKK